MFVFRNKNTLLFLLLLVGYTLLFFVFLGPVNAGESIYKNPAYIQENINKTNCDLNGAWTKEFKYFWLANPEDNKRNFPSFVKNLTYKGVVEKTNKVGISTLESLSLDNVRNNYFLTSPMPNEEIEVAVDLEHNDPYVEWLPLNLYFDPFVLENLNQQVKIKLSYARGSLGEIVYIQDINFITGCYLNLLVKSPPKGEIGKVLVEIKPKGSAKAALSGVFWAEERVPRNLLVNHIGSDKVSAQGFYGKQQTLKKAIFWSPTIDNNEQAKSIVQVSLGDITYATSNGFEFPLDLKSQVYNHQVLKGVSGETGINGLEFYVEPPKETCLEGCNLNLYFTENYRQKIYVYSAYEDRKNNLLAEVTTNGEGFPVFENFYIKPNEDVKLRIRINAFDDLKEPVLRGLSILPPVNEEDEVQVFNSEGTENIQNEDVSDSEATKKESGLSSDTNSASGNVTRPVVINIYPVWFENPRPVLNSGIRPIVNNVRNEDKGDDDKKGGDDKGKRSEDKKGKEIKEDKKDVISEGVSNLGDHNNDKKEGNEGKRSESEEGKEIKEDKKDVISEGVGNLVDRDDDDKKGGDDKGKSSEDKEGKEIKDVISESVGNLGDRNNDKKESSEEKKSEGEEDGDQGKHVRTI